MATNEHHAPQRRGSGQIDMPLSFDGLLEHSSSPEASSSTQETLLTEVDDLDPFMENDMKLAENLHAEEYGQGEEQWKDLGDQNGEIEHYFWWKELPNLTCLRNTDFYNQPPQSSDSTVSAGQSYLTADYDYWGPNHIPVVPSFSGDWIPYVAASTPAHPGTGSHLDLGSPSDDLRLVESYTAWASLRPGVPQCSAEARKLFSLDRFLMKLKLFISQIDWLALDLAFGISVLDKRIRGSDRLPSSSGCHGRKRRRAIPGTVGGHGVTASIFGPDSGMCILLNHTH